MPEVILFATVIAPIILALVEVFKRAINFPKTYIPLVAIFVGVIVGYFGSAFSNLDVELRIWAGVLAGLSATGLFELVTPSKGTTKGGDK